MTTMQIDRAVVEQALEALEDAKALLNNKDRTTTMWFADEITALRAALAQQKDPTDPGNDVDVLREHVRHLERRVRQLHAQQDEPLNLADPAVRKRLATQWGYAPSAQVEPVGEILPNWSTEQERIVGTWAYLNDLGTNLPVGTKLYAAPPQRKPLTEEEIHHATGHCGVSKYTAVNITRAIERAHGIKE